MNKNDFENYYQILGLPDFASIEEVKKAFRELAKKHHPDRGGDPEKFKKILKAYKILSDKEKKKQFDEYLFTFKSKRRNKEYKEKTEGHESINFIPLKETPILNKIKNIVLASIFFIIPFIVPQLLPLAKNRKITFEALILGFFGD
jgi:curved DNA-binding protein CbpA